jgi:flagellar assembly protein FliH
MESHAKFGFDTVFENPENGVSSGDGQTGANWYSGKQITDIQQENYNSGFTDGEARERQSTERCQAQALEVIGTRMAVVVESHNAALGQAADEAAALSLAIARKLVPTLLDQQPLAEVEALLRENLSQLINEPRIVVRVPDALVDALGQTIDALAQTNGFAGRVVLLPDATLSGSDCRMEWADGGVERDTDDIWRDIEAGLARLLQVPGGPVPDLSVGSASASAPNIDSTTLAPEAANPGDPGALLDS